MSPSDVDFDIVELERQLVPTLRDRISKDQETTENDGQYLVETCRESLSAVLPLAENELAFLDRLLDLGEINASLLTDDTDLQQLIERQPLLQWKALNVRKHRGLG